MEIEKVEVLKIEFDGFDWDLANITKVQKHKVSILEVENLFKEETLILPDQDHSQKEQRYIAAGEGDQKPLFVVFTFRQKAVSFLIRPISARYMHKKESEFYEILKKSFS